MQMLAMSATIATSPLNMRALGYLAGLHQFNPSSYFNWCRNHGCFRAAYANGAVVFPKGPKGQSIMAEINKDLEPMMTRIRIADVPDFPETRIVANLYDIDTKYVKEIAQATEEMRESLKKPSTNPLVVRLKARERTELCKVALLTDLGNEAVEADKSVVVFVNFRSTLEALREQFPKCGFIWGDQKPEERQGFIDGFQEDRIQVLLAMTQAGGVGISLHGLPGRRQRVSFITPSDSASDFIQCLGRIHRANGSPSVQTVVLAAGTVEEKIHANLQGKLANLKSLTDGLEDSDLQL
jgi:superfamily II DNA or RNA helicase